MKHKLIIIALFFLTLMFFVQSVWGSYSAVYPYIQKTKKQNVVIKAIPYDPFLGSTTNGLTQVFLKNKLLYSIDNYYSEKLFTSDDGRYLVIIHSLSGNYYEYPAIEILKDGKPCKVFAVKDVIDTAILVNYIPFWHYYYDSDDYSDFYFYKTYSEPNYEYKNYDYDYYKGYKLRTIDRIEQNLFKNSIYVQNNSLFALTNQRTVIKIDFNTLIIEKFPITEIIPNRKEFNPPKTKITYKKIKYPQFVLPNLKSGKSVIRNLAELLDKKAAYNREDSAVIQIYFHTLLINKEGKCEDVYLSVAQKAAYEKDFPYNHPWNPPNEEDENLKLKIKQWVMEQTFDTKTIPKGFQKYKYSDFIYLK